jgi:hypothetical protein
MGLDQYAYVAMKAGARAEHYDDKNYAKDDADPSKLQQPRELAYWRKHPNLHGWMERLWLEKNPEYQDNSDAMFNGVELELTWEDLDRLEHAVKMQMLPPTQGFFFGDGSDKHYQAQDLKFIRDARTELFMGLKVFYNSSW